MDDTQGLNIEVIKVYFMFFQNKKYNVLTLIKFMSKQAIKKAGLQITELERQIRIVNNVFMNNF